jgi:hypothetical protein
MPTVPTYTKCSMLGCKNSKSKHNGLCLEHGGRDTYDYKKHDSNAERKEQIAMYQTAQWKRHRQIMLSKYPLCAACLGEGIVKQAEHIDHVFPWMKIGKTAFYHNLFQSLCAPHHLTKTHLEQRGIFRKYGEFPIDYTLADYERVVR